MKLIKILIALLLMATLGTAGFFGYTLLQSTKEVEVPDFLGKNQSEAIAWCGQLDTKYSCEFLYEESKEVDKDIVFQQSLNAGSVLKDNIMFRVSSALIKPVNLPQLYNATRTEIEEWQNKNMIQNITYVEENSDTVSAGTVIRIDPSENIYTDTAVTVYISSGPERRPDEKIEIKSGEYTNLTVAQFESQMKALGLVPNHKEAKDKSSSTVAKGNIVWHGSGTYENGETINYGICTQGSVSGKINVKWGSYLGKSEEDFRSVASNLGLSPNHKTSKDAYSDVYVKETIVWHGSGDYDKGETINYGLSLGKEGGISEDDLYITKDKYVGKTQDEFHTIATGLGLVPTHRSDRDAYSDTIAKGSIVTHGYGQYEKGEDFNYGLSLGKKDSSSDIDVDIEDLYVPEGKFVGKSEEEFKKIAVYLKLKPVHLSSRDAYSDTVAKGSVVTHGFGQYEEGEDFNYGLSLGKKEGSASEDDLYITQGKYIGKTQDEFHTIASRLGLVATHLSDRDAYSDTIAKGSVVTHGYGQYVLGEDFNYGLSLGKKEGSSDQIVISSGTYIGKTESEIRSIANNLGVSPNHSTARDVYSDSIAQGSVVWHGSGTYEKGETFNYGLSLGKIPDDSVNVVSKANATESEFKSYIEGLGLNLGTKSTEYSNTVGEGKIISNDTGTFKKGSKVNYKVSLGIQPSQTGTIMRPEKYDVGSTYDETKSKMQQYLSVFTDVTYVGVSSTRAVGRIEKIEVGSYGSSYAEGAYPSDTKIIVSIVNKQTN
jgi:beta-lactam-binding protein with PASTA domain